MGELRSTFSNPEGDKPSDVQAELSEIANESRLKSTFGHPESTTDSMQKTNLQLFGKPQEVVYYPAPQNPDRIVVEFVRDDGSKGKTNFSKEEFELRQSQLS